MDNRFEPCVFTIEKKIPIYYMNTLLIDRVRTNTEKVNNFFTVDEYEDECEKLQNYLDIYRDREFTLEIKASNSIRRDTINVEQETFNKMCEMVKNTIIKNGLYWSLITYLQNDYEKLPYKTSFGYTFGSFLNKNIYSFNSHSFELAGMRYHTLNSEINQEKVRIEMMVDLFDKISDRFDFTIVVDKITPTSITLSFSHLNNMLDSLCYSATFQTNAAAGKEATDMNSINVYLTGVQILDNISNDFYDISNFGSSEIKSYLIDSKSMKLLNPKQYSIPDYEEYYDHRKEIEYINEKKEYETIHFEDNGIIEKKETISSIRTKGLPNLNKCDDISKINPKEINDYKSHTQLLGKGALRAKIESKLENEKYGPMCMNFEPSTIINFNYYYEVCDKSDNTKIISRGIANQSYKVTNYIKKPYASPLNVYDSIEKEEIKWREKYALKTGSIPNSRICKVEDIKIEKPNSNTINMVEETLVINTASNIFNMPSALREYEKFKVMMDYERGWKIYDVYKNDGKEKLKIYGNLETDVPNKQELFDKLDINHKVIYNLTNKTLNAIFVNLRSEITKKNLDISKLILYKNKDQFKVKMYRND